MRSRTLQSVLAAAVVFSIAGCGCDQDYPYMRDGFTGDCTPEACSAYCVSVGQSWGYCDGDACICWGSGDAGTEWDIPEGRTITVNGTVRSPGGLVPISGALVYFGLTEPPPIPSGAYPETCTDPPTPYHTLSSPDGSFSVSVAPGDYWFTVQKGQFRRVRFITVPDTDPYTITEDLSTLPSDHGEGDTIPSMALVYAMDNGDHIEDVLAKLEMGDLGPDNTLVHGSEHFDIYNISPYEPNTALLEDVSRMLSYHIIFFPCTIAGFGQLGDPTNPLSNAGVLSNIRAFLTRGGKIYATDMMYDIFEQPLPEFADMCGDDTVINAADNEAWAHTETRSGWTSHGQAIQPDLAAWPDAVGIGSTGIDFLMNFVWIEDLFDIVDPPPDGPQPPMVWVTGDFVLDPLRTLPLTITFPYGA
ncbi:MAG: carboxypeptidase regulatory-like domain-containing protein, partial [Deltaproteobacteria bacterium]|nr:carboxypeptidase regulatory-like domain-containing protein [Deltaproteobacteria bacterium]